MHGSLPFPASQGTKNAASSAGANPRDRAPSPDGWRARIRRVPIVAWPLAALAVLVLAWLVATAPPWRSGGDLSSQSLTFLASDGSVIARKGQDRGSPVDLSRMPSHVAGAFVAIEDRRFWRHPGIDLRGMARAAWNNLVAGSVVEGASTITQQYVKGAYLTNDRTVGRKLREVLLAVWVEIWRGKEDILGAYLSQAYFGEGAYGISAASRTYFGKDPARLTVAEAAMLAGLVKAPSRLAPTKDLTAAHARTRVVLEAMEEEGMLAPGQAAALRLPRLRPRAIAVPAGSYFSDWLAAQVSQPGEGGVVATTLDADLQRRAARAFERARLGNLQAALVAMRPDGRVVAMLGGRSYERSPFNRATQARRQPGSAFKLFVYLAALRAGARPDDLVSDTPISIDGWRPENADGRYRGLITLRDAFAVSSNVAAVRISEVVGRSKVSDAAAELGVTSPLPDEPSLALGAGTMTLLELTAAYAAIAQGSFPVTPTGVEPALRRKGRFGPERALMLDLLWQAANVGTGRQAALAQPTFGKTGTSQDGRDALFIGFAGDLVAGVWVGRDDNDPVRGSSGGKLPAAIWRDFMGGVPLRPVNSAPTFIDRPDRETSRAGARAERQSPQKFSGSQKRGKGKGRGRGKKD